MFRPSKELTLDAYEEDEELDHDEKIAIEPPAELDQAGFELFKVNPSQGRLVFTPRRLHSGMYSKRYARIHTIELEGFIFDDPRIPEDVFRLLESLPVGFTQNPDFGLGLRKELRHIAEAIAVNLREMMLFGIPIIATVIGEGGSGGALGIGVADRVLILENAYYSVISPEGCAAILWKDRAAASKAAEALKISAKNLLDLGLVDEIVPEPLGGAHNNPEKMAETLRDSLLKHLEQLLQLPRADRLKQRYAKFRAYGHFAENQPAAAVDKVDESKLQPAGTQNGSEI